MAETLTDEGQALIDVGRVRRGGDIIACSPSIHVIVTDLRMLEKTGADLINIVEAKWGQNIKVIFMSGHGTGQS